MNSKERLIQAARDQLIEVGEAGSSVKAIARRAGVNHGLVHHYFGSKEHLWVAVLDKEEREIREELDGAIEEASEDFLRKFYLPNLIGNPHRMRLIIEFFAVAKKYDSAAKALGNLFRLRRETFGRLFNLDDPATPLLVLGAFLGMALQSHMDPELEIAPAAEQLLKLITSQSKADQASKNRQTH